MAENTQRVEEIIPIAKEFIRLLAEEDTLMGDLTQEELNKAYVPITDKLINHLIEKDVNLGDVDFAFRLAMQAFETLASATNNTITRMYGQALKEKFGKDRLDLKMSDIKYVVNE